MRDLWQGILSGVHIEGAHEDTHGREALHLPNMRQSVFTNWSIVYTYEDACLTVKKCFAVQGTYV